MIIKLLLLTFIWTSVLSNFQNNSIFTSISSKVGHPPEVLNDGNSATYYESDTTTDNLTGIIDYLRIDM